ncbi:ABC transporter permease [Oscillatoria sp. FACHB-1407]|uniref:ABC transporter permease n=1 Tax=Oscillatoria sp. FACHB-1407 TaxID=2692847 RepID=UPI0016834896|nr:ABC transporter permease [Oscillatoria sp. FACHB-1407]MBD2459803.1 ABC transporter permease [Oscillatoria sp. FACHB-1407]
MTVVRPSSPTLRALPLQAIVDKLLPLLGVLLLFVVWWFISISGWVNPVLLPTPIATLARLFSEIFGGTMMTDFAATVLRTFQAFLMAAVVGVPLGVALGSSERVYRSVEFLIDFFRSTPASALIPMFILFFGVSDISKVIIAAFSALLLILFNSAYGVMNAKRSRILAAKVMGANRLQIFRDVLLFESLPQTFIGLRSGISIALVIVIVAEMFIGTEQGLGKRIIDAQQILNVQDMYASILITGILGYFLNVFFLLVEKRFIHWSGK